MRGTPSMSTKPQLRYLLASAFICLVHSYPIAALEYTIEFVGPLDSLHKKDIDILPFSKKSKDIADILIIETSNNSATVKNIDGDHEESSRYINFFNHTTTGWELKQRVALTNAMGLIDIVRTPSGDKLAGYQNDSIFFLDRQTLEFKEELKMPSIFAGDHGGTSLLVDLFKDINGDQLDDILIPHFNGWQIALQTQKGFSDTQTVGPTTTMRFQKSARYVAYSAEQVYLVDEDHDGLDDIAFWDNGFFAVYRQNAQGEFATSAVPLNTTLDNMLSNYSKMLVEKDNDTETEPTRLVEEIIDIDADGIDDLVVKKIKSEGIFGWESEYEIYLGSSDENNYLQFAKTPSSVIHSDGFQFNHDREDITGDGKQEFIITSAEISLGAIIKALLTRRVSINVSIYKINNGIFQKKPNTQRTISAKLNFGSGDISMPAVLTADVTGDGRKDLLVQKGKDTLMIFQGTEGPQMFDKKSVEVTMDLPNTGNGFTVADLNHDGRDEVIVQTESNNQAKIAVISFSH
jgi:hypothetical protein